MTDDEFSDIEHTKQKNHNLYGIIWKKITKKYNQTYKNTKKVTFQVLLSNSKKCNHALKYISSTDKMIWHLANAQKIIDPNKIQLSQKYDYTTKNYYLIMFIISASLPFLCVNNLYFKIFIYSKNPEFKIPDRRTLSHLATEFFFKKKRKES